MKNHPQFLNNNAHPINVMKAGNPDPEWAKELYNNYHFRPFNNESPLPPANDRREQVFNYTNSF